jgi:hypothetical protein
MLIKMHVGGIFCDLAEAFNSVNHKILLTKLVLWHSRVTANWFRSYLKNRKQKIEIKQSNSAQIIFSSWGTIKHEVPQGSIFGLCFS